MSNRIRTETNIAAGIVCLAMGLGIGASSARAQQPAATPAAAPTATTAPARTAAPAPAAAPAAAATPAPAVAPAAATTQRTAYYMPAQTQPTVPMGDPYGFTNWLNSVRASYGLPAVGYDPNLTNWASMNNAQQAARGIGHFVMGPARRQNSAMGPFSSIGAMWLNSPGHRAALLDPSIRWIGIAGWGAYWTFNAY